MIEATCADCGESPIWVPADEDANDTLCAVCADDQNFEDMTDEDIFGDA